MGTFTEFFRAATGYFPFRFQVRFAEEADLPTLVDIPTGCGKTAITILGWLWRRRFRSETRATTPRRPGVLSVDARARGTDVHAKRSARWIGLGYWLARPSGARRTMTDDRTLTGRYILERTLLIKIDKSGHRCII